MANEITAPITLIQNRIDGPVTTVQTRIIGPITFGGAPGRAATITIGTITTGAAGSSVTITNTGTIDEAVLNFTIPKGDKGDNGPVNTLTIGTVTEGSAAATITGAAPNQTLNLVVPKGNPGVSNALSIGTVTEGAAAATITGTSPTQTLNLVIPKGDPGSAATISIGNVTTGAAGSSATVTNSGTSGAAVLDFSIPQGDKGDTGLGITPQSIGFTMTAGTTPHTLTVTTSGTLGSAAYADTGAFAPSSTTSFPGFGTDHTHAAYGDHTHATASTSSSGFMPTIDSAGVGMLKVIGNENGETAPSSKDIFSASYYPLALGIANGGASVKASREDHIHPAVTPTTLGLVIGTNVQAYNANLTGWAGKTAFAGTLTITTGKTLNATNTLTFSGTDGSTLNIGTGGTLGTAAYTAATAYAPSSGIAIAAMSFGTIGALLAAATTIEGANNALGTYSKTKGSTITRTNSAPILSTTAAADDPDLAGTLEARATYAAILYLPVATTANAGFKAGFYFSSADANNPKFGVYFNDLGTFGSMTQSNINFLSFVGRTAAMSSASITALIIFRTTSSTGTWSVRWAQNVSHADNTQLLAGASATLIRLA